MSVSIPYVCMSVGLRSGKTTIDSNYSAVETLKHFVSETLHSELDTKDLNQSNNRHGVARLGR